MFEKLKAYCNYELENVEKRGYSANQACTRCYGAVMFICHSYHSLEDEVRKWWDDEMHPKFWELQREGY